MVLGKQVRHRGAVMNASGRLLARLWRSYAPPKTPRLRPPVPKAMSPTTMRLRCPHRQCHCLHLEPQFILTPTAHYAVRSSRIDAIHHDDSLRRPPQLEVHPRHPHERVLLNQHHLVRLSRRCVTVVDGGFRLAANCNALAAGYMGAVLTRWLRLLL